MEKVSIIVPTYRKFDNLENNLISIFKQTYSNLELIITDDGSENYSEKFIKSIISKLKNARNNIEITILHHSKNLGSVKNANKAIEVSTGEYIFFLAQDDEFYDKYVIENIIKNFSGNICTAYRECISEKGEIIGTFPTKERLKKLSLSINYLDLLINGNYISGACTYFRKEVFQKYGLFDENMKLLEDYPYYLMLMRKKEKINFIPLKAIKYNYGGVSTSKNINLVLLDDFKKVIEREKKLLDENKYLKRILEYKIKNYEYIMKKKNKKKLYFLYLDIIIFNVLKKFFKINIYNFLMKVWIKV